MLLRILAWARTFIIACGLGYALAYGPFFCAALGCAVFLDSPYPWAIATSSAWAFSWLIFPFCPFMQNRLVRWWTGNYRASLSI
jgi:hypothetical protein